MVLDGKTSWTRENGTFVVGGPGYPEEMAAVTQLVESGAITEDQLLDAYLKGDAEAVQSVTSAWNALQQTKQTNTQGQP